MALRSAFRLNRSRATARRCGTVLLSAAALLAVQSPLAQEPSVAELETQVEELTRQLNEANARLAAARAATPAVEASDSAGTEPDTAVARTNFELGPVAFGGAIRANYVYGDYTTSGSAPQRGGNGGDVELDTFRINAALDYEQFIGKFEYRWYNGYNFLHTLWLGYDFAQAGELQVGITRVPFGPGPYGVSQSWFFDQHYYVGLSDDMDAGIKYIFDAGRWTLDVAWFLASEGNWNGASEDSARYSYDAVVWESAIGPDGDVTAAPSNGYKERNQVNLRAIYHLAGGALSSDIGFSLQAGQLKGKQVDDGDHWAGSVHMVNHYGPLTLATQLTRYEMDVDDDGALGTDELVTLGAYDFAWPVASRAWVPALSLSYRYDTPRVPWLTYVLPYIEYSSIVKEDSDYSDSQMLIVGAAWSSGGWYIYSDWAYSNGNLFIGNEGDNYANIYEGVGDFGVDGNDRWNYRLNLNLGYYF